MKYLILSDLSKIEILLYEIYENECSCNEGSLTEQQLYDIVFLINRIRENVEVKK